MPTDSTLSPPRRRRHAEPLRLLRAAAYAVAGLCLLPILAVTLAGVTGGVETLTHLAQTVLPRYAGNTLVLVACVALGTLSIGTGAACFVTMTEFRGRRLFEILLVVPLAFPAYVLAYAYTHLLDHPGIVQSTLREVMGWGPRDYWFPEIRSLGGAAAMLVLVLYPYVYLLARAAFLGQSASTFHAARALGNTPLQAFLKVTLPMARPAIAAGVLLATMETIADFGTVSYFGVPTFATGIYTSWFSMADRAAAAQLSLGLLAFALTLAVLERRSRGEAKYHTGQRVERLTRLRLHGSSEFAAWALCAVPVLFGAVIPIVALVIMVLGFFHRAARGPGARWAIYAGRLGYAVPGGVIAVGLMVPFAAFDNALDAVMRDWFGVSTGLLFTGSIWVLVFAYMIRFMAAAIGAYEGGQSAINPNLDAASRVLGQSSYGTLRRIHLPILTPSLLTALLIVFVDVMKELPATLILRPFNYDTLAVQAHRLAADERLEGAAVPSLVIVAVGVLPVILLCRRVGRE
jgi:iron(III) transport system permease protein